MFEPKEGYVHINSNLQQSKLADLKLRCEEYDLPTNGKKRKLVRRIVEFYKEIIEDEFLEVKI